MWLEQAQSRISDLMVKFVTQVKAAASMRKTDINRVSETFLVPLLSEVLDLPNLQNLNTAQKEYPGLDLGDRQAGVGIQVTSTPTAKKIKDTLQKCIAHEAYRYYPHVKVYVLTEKQSAYHGRGIDAITDGYLEFDKSKDVIDYRTVLSLVAASTPDRIQRVLHILEAHLGEGSAPLFEPTTIASRHETAFLNLLELELPDTLYVADLLPEVLKAEKSHRVSARDKVRSRLKALGLRSPVDWVTHERSLISFHDLSDRSIALSKLIDAGTVTELSPWEYYSVGDDYERAFKSLVGTCMQQKLFPRGIKWQHELKLFIFSETVEGQKERREQWVGLKTSTRTVYERVMKTNKPDEIYYCKHLAFRTSYHYMDGAWFVGIMPDWFFSHDGYRHSFYAADRVEWLKRNERNSHVFNHLKFIVHFISSEEPLDLFRNERPYLFLGLRRLASFDDCTPLDDQEWLTGEQKETRDKLDDPSGVLPLPFDNP